MASNNENEMSVYEKPSDKAVSIYEDMFSKVPEPSGEAYDRILEQIAEAKDLSAIDMPWKAGSLGKLNGKELLINGISKMPSDYEGGFGYYLLIDAVDKDTGESLTLTTGSITVVAELVRVNALGAFPASFVVRKASKPTRNGYYPLHLEVVK